MLAQDDFGFDIERCIRGYRITRGPMFGFRLWRFLFEVLRSATDKRQAHVHTVGRFSYATIRAPSAILGELSETKVPGEPFTIAVEGNWRPYLPLPDDFVSILNLSWLFPRTVRFYTCQGVTEVQGPRGLLRRLKTGYRLTKDFAAYARLRNWDEKAASTPDAYIEAMQKLGNGLGDVISGGGLQVFMIGIGIGDRAEVVVHPLPLQDVDVRGRKSHALPKEHRRIQSGGDADDISLFPDGCFFVGAKKGDFQ